MVRVWAHPPENLPVCGAGERFVEAAGLASGFIGVNDAPGGRLIVELLGLVPDLGRPLGGPRVDGPVEVFGEVPQVGTDGLVLLVLSAVLLVAFGWCGHPLAPFVFKRT